MVEKINDNTVKISGRIDSNNASQFEKELFEAVGENIDSITVDAAKRIADAMTAFMFMIYLTLPALQIF